MKQFLCLFSIFFSLSSSSQTTYYFNKLYDNDTLWDIASTILETDSGYLINGSTIDLNASYPDDGYRILSFKTDEKGNLKKKMAYEKKGFDITGGIEGNLINNFDGTYSTGGYINDRSTGLTNILLTKYNNNGDTLWTKVIGDSLDNEVSYSCRQTKDSGYIFCGWSKNFGQSNIQVMLLKVDSVGNIIWEKQFGGSGNDVGFSVEQTFDGGYIIGGYYDINGVSGRMWVIKTDDTGNFVWDKKVNANLTAGALVFQSKDSNYIVYSGKDNLDGNQTQGYIVKLDSNGVNIIWEKTYGGQKDDGFWHVVELNDGKFIVIGVSESNPSTTAHGWLMKLKNNGDSIWSKNYYVQESAGWSYARFISQNKDGSLIVCGDALSFDNSQDAWVLKLDSNGNTCSFVGCDSVVLGVQNEEFRMKNVEVEVYPNPFSHTAYLRITNLSEYTNKKMELSIYNLLGEKVKQSTIVNQQSTITREGLPNGIYFYQIKTKNETIANGKLVVSD